MKKLKEIIDAHKRKVQFEKEAEIKADFDVVERGGYLWFTHNGVAFSKIENRTFADEISAALKKAREVAIEFERL